MQKFNAIYGCFANNYFYVNNNFSEKYFQKVLWMIENYVIIDNDRYFDYWLSVYINLINIL